MRRSPGSTIVLSNESKTGFGGYAAIGRRIGDFRVELEYGRTENDSDRYFVTTPFMAEIAQDGETDISRYMANAYFDLNLEGSRFTPYLGAGVGAASIHSIRIAGTFANPTPMRLVDDSATYFAWQAMAGLAIAVTPRLQFTTQYRWFDAGTVDLEDARGEAVTADVAGSHVDIGLRYSF